MDTSPGTTAPGCTPNSDKHANAQLGTWRILRKQAPLLPRRVRQFAKAIDVLQIHQA
jgi:hypothetical protein